MFESPLSHQAAFAMIEALPTAVLVAAQESQVIRYANAAACAMFCRSKEALLQLSLADIDARDGGDDRVALIRTGLTQNENRAALSAIPCRRADGTSFFADVTWVPVEMSGVPCIAGFFSDVTERMRADHALRESAEIAARVFQVSPKAIGISRMSDGVFLDINPAFTELTGFTREDLVGKTALPEDRGLWTSADDRELLLRALSTGAGTAHINVRCRHKSGSIIHGLMHARVMTLNGQRCLLTEVSDASDVKVAEMALFAEKERLRVTLHSIADGVITTDTEGSVVLMNRVAERLTGWTQAEAARQSLPNVFRIVDEVTGQTREDPASRVIATGVAAEQGRQTVLVSRQGTRRIIADSAAPIHDANGALLGAVLVFRDVTEREQAEASLRQSEEKFRTIIEQTTDGVMVTDDAGTIIEWNPAMAAVTGIGREKALGQAIWQLPIPLRAGDVEHAFSQQGFHDLRARMVSGGVPAKSSGFMPNAEIHFARGEETITAYQTFFPIRTGKTLRVGCILRDVTERQRFVAALQKSDKLESLGVLAGGIAHDFNNLLCGIYGALELARSAEKDPNVLEYFDACVHSMDRVRALTKQLLTFAKGGAPVRHVGPLFPFVRTSVEFALSGSSVSCRFDIEPLLHDCNFDKHQVGQVIDNIVINAVQAMPKGGTLFVSAANVLVRAGEYPSLPEGEYVRLSFRDQGTGISPAILTRIFDPFFSTKPSGTGLGLATSYSIVRQHAGHISVESELGQGSEFHVLLPASRDVRSVPPPAPGVTHTGTGMVLVMDDDPDVRRVASQLLTRMGYTCRTAADGRDALVEYSRLVEEGGRWRAILSDLTIPGAMNGEEFVRELRKVDAVVPVIVSSGYADDPVMAEPVKFGFTGSLAKPYTMNELAQVLARCAR